MKRLELKNQVCLLRGEGKTYLEIKSILNINLPKSTLSEWCQGIKLPDWYNDKIKELNSKSLSKAQKMAFISNKNKRELFLKIISEQASKVASSLDKKNLKIILATLYLAEGAKWKGHSGLMLGSSDPDIILLYMELLGRCYDIKPIELKCRISYRADQDILKLESFWSKITDIPLKNFYKTKPDPRTIGKKTQNKEYRGVCVLTCKGVKIQLELEQIMKILISQLRAHSSAG